MSNKTTNCINVGYNYVGNSDQLNIGSLGNDIVSGNCDDEYENNIDNNDSCDTPSILDKLKLKNVNRLVIGHLNINSLSRKFDQLKTIIGKNIDILVITETKIDSSFPNSQFKIEGFSMPYRFDRNRFGGDVMIFVRDDIPSKHLTRHKLPDDIESVFIEVNLRKT